MRDLTEREIRKLKLFRDIMTQESMRTSWINRFVSKLPFRIDIVCEGIEAFLSATEQDMKEFQEEEGHDVIGRLDA